MSLSLEIHWDEEVTKKLKKLEAPVNNWLLRKNILTKVYSTYAEVYNNLFYAEFVHEGTNPHIIMPKFKKSLHRIDPKSWEDRFAKLVHHPGYKGNPFFTRSVDNKKSYIIDRFNSIIDSYLND